MNRSLLRSIREIVRLSISESSLTEADAYTKKFGKRFPLYKEFEKHVDEKEDGICNYAFTMTSLEKVGINPKSKYETPAGIYFYPLTKENYNALLDWNLPFVNEAKYVSLVKLKKPSRWLDVTRESNEYQNVLDLILENVYVFLTDEWRQKTIKDHSGGNKKTQNELKNRSNKELLDWVVNNFGKNQLSHSDNIASKIFDYTYFASRYLKNPQATWSRILTEAGVHGIYDDGGGVIHPNEPSQLVSFRKEYVEVIGTYETSSIRRSTKEISDKIPDNVIISKIYSEKSIEKLKKLYSLYKNSENTLLLQQFATNKATPSEILEELSYASNPFLAAEVAKNRKTSKEALDRLASHKHEMVRRSVVSNPKTSKETLEKLKSDQSWEVSAKAAQKLS